MHWAYGNGLDDRLIAFLRFRPELLFDFDCARNPIAFPSPRSWEFAHRALMKFSDTPLLLLEALQACVGKAAGVELHAFMAHLDRMPDIDAILRGEDVAAPQEIDLQYAVATALVTRALRAAKSREAPDIYGHILSFASKFPLREMGVMLVSDLQRVADRPLFFLPQFSRWANDVADLVLETP